MAIGRTSSRLAVPTTMIASTLSHSDIVATVHTVEAVGMDAEMPGMVSKIVGMAPAMASVSHSEVIT